MEDQAPDAPYTTVVQMHPCELQPPCRCERVDLDRILKLPEEQDPRCFGCLKPLRGLGYTRTEILWMKVVSKLNWREDPGMRLLPAPFQIGCYNARARSRANRGRSSTGGEAAASGLTPEGSACPSPFAHAAAAARPVQVRPPRGGRPLCERCVRQRPGDRVRCLRCQRRVGPGCTPGCLLVELRGTARERVGLCADWPYCRTQEGDVEWSRAVGPCQMSCACLNQPMCEIAEPECRPCVSLPAVGPLSSSSLSLSCGP